MRLERRVALISGGPRAIGAAEAIPTSLPQNGNRSPSISLGKPPVQIGPGHQKSPCRVEASGGQV